MQPFTETFLNSDTPPKVDIITGGFPCPDISISGPGAGLVGWRSRLWYEYLRIIFEVQPRYIIIENSPELANKGLEIILYDLTQIGYNAEWQCLSASDFGYPIIRKRLFVVAFTMQSRCTNNIRLFTEIPGTFPQRITRPADLPMSLKRFNHESDFTAARVRAGFSKGLDKNRIAAIGDAVNVTVAQYVLRCVKIFDNSTNTH